MQLDTAKFGPVSFTLEEVLLLDGLGGRPTERRWLLLSDRHHRCLHWLQSVDNPQRAMAAVALSRAPRCGRLAISRQTANQLGLASQTPVIALVPLCSDGLLATSSSRLILINPHRRIGRQVSGFLDAPRSAQPVQTARARKIA